MTINKVCGSGLKALHLAAQTIACGEASIVVAGGQESMSMSPHVLSKSRTGQRMGDWSMSDTMITDGLWCAFNNYHKAAAAQGAGKFREQIVPVGDKKGPRLDVDEYIKTNAEDKDFVKMKPAFKRDGGTVTAGNASGINDGAALCLVMSASKAKELGLEPLASIRAFASAGVDPKIMGTGPIPASRLCLERAKWTVQDLDLIEANEAFAAQALAVNEAMAWDASKVNVNGGAIAIGHPIGASGCRIAVDLLHEMKRSGKQRGLATLCIGGGQGVAMCFERPSSSPPSRL
jgi:acetyl-CoA C-acetyltransferase